MTGRRLFFGSGLTAAVVVAALAALWISGSASSGGSVALSKAPEPAVPAEAPGPAALSASPTTIQRTFVSTTGSDASACTAAEPCRNFAAAIANTTAGGEVVALTSGGYGAFTVPKAITIAGAPGAHVAVTGFAGTAVDVNAGTNDVVVLRNLYLTGLGADFGILLQSDSILHVDSVVVTGFANKGLLATNSGSQLFIRDSTFRHNAAEGVVIAGPFRAEIVDTRSEGNGRDESGVGFDVEGNSSASFVRCTATGNLFHGFLFFNGRVTVSGSVADGNGADGISAAGSVLDVTISGSTLTGNASAGLRATASSVVRIGGSTVTGNDTGLAQTGASTLGTFQDNLVRGNTTQTSGTLTLLGKT